MKNPYEVLGVSPNATDDEVKKAYQVKVYQTISILPSFLSWVAVGYIVYTLLDTNKGVINTIIQFFPR